MKILLITVAGTSSRFGKSIGGECLKCIYYEHSPQDTLLYKMIYRDLSFDKYVIVGGYKFSELSEYADRHLNAVKEKIVLIENVHYSDYGSCYSLYLGLDYALKNFSDAEIVFAEGDLWIDKQSFLKVSQSDKDVITYNKDCIDAKKSVVFYYDEGMRVHYLYDTSHNLLEINEPFQSIYNSGQIWKFCDFEKVKRVASGTGLKEWKGTNLVIIQKYFGNLDKSDYFVIGFNEWYNCNTVEDYREISGRN